MIFRNDFNLTRVVQKKYQGVCNYDSYLVTLKLSNLVERLVESCNLQQDFSQNNH